MLTRIVDYHFSHPNFLTPRECLISSMPSLPRPVKHNDGGAQGGTRFLPVRDSLLPSPRRDHD